MQRGPNGIHLTNNTQKQRLTGITYVYHLLFGHCLMWSGYKLQIIFEFYFCPNSLL